MQATCQHRNGRQGGIVLCLAGLLCLFVLNGCSIPGMQGNTPQVGQQPAVAIDWTDFLQFKGISYHLLAGQTGTLQEKDLGNVYDTVKFQVSGNVNDPNYQIKDGDAAYLPVGTRVYTLKDYQPWFRLAVPTPGTQHKLAIYEVNANRAAKYGSDLLDIAGKVTFISLLNPKDGKAVLGQISDPQQIEQLVTMLLQAPVNPLQGNNEFSCFLVLHLKDGTTVSHPYWKAENTYDNLALPPDFKTAILQVLLD